MKRMTGIGRRIRQERRAREWSQRFLGKLVGISRQTMCGYEYGHTHPNKETIRKLESLFQIDLQGGNDEKPESTS